MAKMACSRLWTDINLNVHKKQVRNCCKTAPMAKPSVEALEKYGIDYWTQRPELLEQKQKWLETDWFPETCKQCERDHPNSLWQTWNWWKDNPDSFFEDILEKDLTNHIEIALSSVCNQTCLYCNADTSSMWAKVLNEPVNDPEADWKTKSLESLMEYIDKRVAPRNSWQRYNFMGGETFLVPEFFDIVERISSIHKKHNSNNVEMNFISNLNLKPALIDKFLKLTQDNSNIKWYLSASIENVGSRAEVLREGLDFKLFESNLDKLLQAKSLTRIQILPSINALSVYDHKEFLDWVWKKCVKYRGTEGLLTTWLLTTNIVNYPRWLSCKVLPEDAKKVVDETIEFIKSKKSQVNEKQAWGLDQYIRHMKSVKNTIGTLRTPEVLEEGRNNLKRFEKLFNRNYSQDFFEFDKIYNANTSTNKQN